MQAGLSTKEWSQEVTIGGKTEYCPTGFRTRREEFPLSIRPSAEDRGRAASDCYSGF